MTVVLHKDQSPGAPAWSQMPGWGIVADLTPPELRARRALKVLRRWIVGVLALVVLLCVGGYVAAERSADSARTALAAEQSRSAALEAQVAKHSRVSSVQAMTATFNTQLSQLFADDVDVPSLVQALTGALPPGMGLTSMNVTLTASGSSGAVTGSIGNVTVSGTAAKLIDLTAYVNALNTIPGVSQVIPSTNAASGGQASWTLILQVTQARFDHRFASTSTPTDTTPVVTPTGGN